jgi:ribosomal protein S18 acetylase RimI-like enzyme
MDDDHALQIAELLNSQNQLEIEYDAARVLKDAAEYLVDYSGDGRVTCCAQLKKVQWYQAEICHVTTHPDFARQGRGSRLIERAETEARRRNARVLQCTIREGNGASEGLFTKAGFVRGATFRNPQSGNLVTVWTKSLYPQ